MSETVEQIKQRRYEWFIGDREPLPWTPGQCAGYVGKGSLRARLYRRRCKRKDGHGRGRLFCKQHADRDAARNERGG